LARKEAEELGTLISKSREFGISDPREVDERVAIQPSDEHLTKNKMDLMTFRDKVPSQIMVRGGKGGLIFPKSFAVIQVVGKLSDFTLLSIAGTLHCQDINLLAEKTYPGMETVW